MSQVDFQRQLVYDFEWYVIRRKRGVKRPRMNKQSIYEMVDGMMSDYRVRTPYLIMFFSEKSAEAGWQRTVHDVKSFYLNFPEGYRDAITVCHEMAHILTFNRRDTVNEQHGPIYVGIYFQLLSEYLGYDLPDLYKKAEKFGVKVISNDQVRKRWRNHGMEIWENSDDDAA